MTSTDTSTAHGGILFPLDPIRLTMVASVVGEMFVSRARNVLDATVSFTRHPEAPLVLMRMTGSIVEPDDAAFWRENADLGVMLSQMLPRQVFVYWATSTPKREGFLIAQGGRALAGDEVDEDQMPPDATAADWPVAKLAEQLRLSVDELANGFLGGPRVELPVVDVTGDDRELLETLAGAPPDGDDGPEPSETDVTAPDAEPPAPKAPSAADDAKRRALERDAEREEREAAAAAAADGLRSATDEHGIVVAVDAELGDTDILGAYVVRKVDGELPGALDPAQSESLQGKRVDFCVRIDFLSEVFFDDSPLSKPAFEEHAQTRTIAGSPARVLGVHAPRLSAGTLVVSDAGRVFVSRDPSLPLPDALIASVLN
jgi:hypothetical protein